MKLKNIFLILFAVSPLVGMADVIKPDSIKVFFVYPLTNHRTTESSWLDIVACEKPNAECHKLIARLALQDIKLNGTIEARFDKVGALQAIFVSEEGKQEILLAREELTKSWYPRVEICETLDSKPACKYTVERNSGQKSLSLVISRGDT